MAARKKTAKKKATARKKAAVKKKQVLADDPLAWMAEEASLDIDQPDDDAAGDAEVAASAEVQNEPEVKADDNTVTEATKDDPAESTSQEITEQPEEQSTDEDAAATEKAATEVTEMADKNIQLEGGLTIREAGELFEQLKAELAKKTDIELDFSAVDNIDTAIAQMLLALSEDVAASGKKLTLKSLPDSVKTTFERLGMDQLAA